MASATIVNVGFAADAVLERRVRRHGQLIPVPSHANSGNRRHDKSGSDEKDPGRKVKEILV
jgi:hypothetical protein